MMHQNRRPGLLRRGLLSLSAAVLLGPLCGTVRADSIELIDGERIERISSMSATWELVEYRVRKRKKRVPGGQIARLIRDSERLASARSLQEAGDFAAALAALKDFSEDGAEEWEVAEAAYRIGEVQARLGRQGRARKALEAYLDDYRDAKDWFVPAALATLGEILLASGQSGTAQVHFKELEGMGARWELRSKLGQGKALLASRGKSGAQDARKLFLEVVRGTSDIAVRQDAQVARAEALIVAENPTLAIKELEKAFFNAPKPEALRYGAARARACLLMSRAQVELGKKDRQNARKYLEKAELWALRVAVLHRTQAQEFGEACDFLAKLYQRLGQKERAAAWKERKEATAS